MNPCFFDAIAVYPKRSWSAPMPIDSPPRMRSQRVMVGVWLGWRISPEQYEEIMGINGHIRGHLWVTIGKKTGTTTVKFLPGIPIRHQGDTRKAMRGLVHILWQIIGCRPVLPRCLPDVRAVSRALAVT